MIGIGTYASVESHMRTRMETPLNHILIDRVFSALLVVSCLLLSCASPRPQLTPPDTGDQSHTNGTSRTVPPNPIEPAGIRAPPSIDAAACSRGVSYPREARELGIQGAVHLRVAIDERGHVSDVKVISGLGHGLDEAAVSAIRSAQCQFTPALANDGRAVPYVIKRYTFQFQLP